MDSQTSNRIQNFFKSPEINNLLNDFRDNTGITVVIKDQCGIALSDHFFSPKSKTVLCRDVIYNNRDGKKRCDECAKHHIQKANREKKSLIYECWNKFINIVTPIYYKGNPCAYFFCGQLLYEDVAIDMHHHEKVIKEFNLNSNDYMEALNNTQRISREQIKVIADRLFSKSNIISNSLIEYQVKLLGYQNAVSDIKNIQETTKKPIDTLKRIADTALKLIEAATIDLYEYDPETNQFQIPPIRVGDHKYADDYPEKIDETNIAYDIVKTGEMRFIEDIKNHPSNASFLRREELISSIGVPMKFGSETFGVIFAGFRKKDKLNQDANLLDKFQVFANLGASVIQNKKVLDKQRKRNLELEVLNSIGKISSKINLQDIAKNIYEQTKRLLNATNFFICLYDKNMRELNFLIWVYNGEIIDNSIIRKEISGLVGEVIKFKKTILINDWEKEKDHYPPNTEEIVTKKQRSWLGVPLSVDNEILGVITVQSPKAHEYNGESERILEMIAVQSSIVLENARLLEEEKNLRWQTESLKKSMNKFNSLLKMDKVSSKMLEILKEIITYDRAAVEIIQYNKRLLMANDGYTIPELNLLIQRPISGNRLITEIFEKREPLAIHDTTNLDGKLERLDENIEAKAWLGLPIECNNEIIALIIIESDTPNTFISLDFISLQSILDDMSIYLYQAIENDKLRYQYKALEVVNEITKNLNLRQHEEELINTISSTIKRNMNYEYCNIYLADNNNGNSQLKCKNTEYPDKEKKTIAVADTTSPVSWVFRNKISVIDDDVNKDTRFQINQERRKDPRSFIGSPIFINDQTIGVLSVAKNQFGYFDEIDKQMVESLSNHLGFALERHRGLDLLEDIGEKIIEADDLNLVLERIVSGAIELTNTDTGIIYLFDENKSKVDAEYSPTPEIHYPPRLTEKVSLTRHVIKTQKIYAVKDLSQDQLINPKLRSKYQALIAVPLLKKMNCIGILYLNDKDIHDFSAIEKTFLSTLTKQAVIAIEKAKMMQQITDQVDQLKKQNISLQQLFSLNTLTGGFFHKVKGYVNFIPSHVQELKKHELKTKEKNDLLNDIKNGAINIINLANRVSRTVRSVPENFHSLRQTSLQDLLEKVRKDIERDKKLKLKNIEIKVHYDNHELSFKTFRALFQRALMDIIANAIEAMQPKGGTLTLDLKKGVYNDKDSAILQIIDTGEGIKESKYKDIFEIHYSTKKDGFGYGLWYVKLVLNATNIEYEVNSKIGKGTTFTLYIPLT